MWHYANRDVPYLRNYAEALAHHNHIIPLRGQKNRGVRPLGARKKSWEQIQLSSTNCVEVRLAWSNGVIVRFHPDGRVELPGGRSMTRGNLGLIGAVLGVGMRVTDGRAYTGTMPGRDSDGLVHRGEFCLETDHSAFCPRFSTNEGRLVYENPPVEYTYHADLSGRRMLRKEYAEFLKFSRAYLSLVGGDKYEDQTSYSDIIRKLHDEAPDKVSEELLKWATSQNRYSTRTRGYYIQWHALVKSEDPLHHMVAALVEGSNERVLAVLYNLHALHAFKKVVTPFGQPVRHKHPRVEYLMTLALDING